MRRVGTPEAVFRILGEQLAEAGEVEVDPGAFCALRIAAEQLARSAHPRGEPALAQIWRSCAGQLDCESRWEALMRAELDLEARLLSPNPVVMRTVSAARADRRNRIGWISDTYFSSDWLREQLSAHGLIEDADGLYVSCEAGLSKAAGGALFAFVAESEGVALSAMTHYGNHAEADVRIPRSLGVRVRPQLTGNPTRYEAGLDGARDRVGSTASVIAGAAIRTRTVLAEADRRDDPLDAVVVGAGAPLLIPFVHWLLLRAQEQGLSRLYFSARDGEVLLPIARSLQARLELAEATQLRYLHGGRRVWHRAAVGCGAVLESSIVEHAEPLPPAQAAARLGLRDEVAEQLASELGLESGVALGDGAQRFVAAAARAAREAGASVGALERAAGYLEQEGLMGSGRFGCVDLGWRGRAMASLRAVLEHLRGEGGGDPPRWLFHSLHGTLEDRAALPDAEAFVRDARGGSAVPEQSEVLMLEGLCAGTAGQTMDFELDGASWVPVLREERNARLLHWGIERAHEGLRVAAGAYADGLVASGLRPRGADLRAVAQAGLMQLAEFWSRPSRREAVRWGSLPFARDQEDEVWEHMAEPLVLRELLAALRLCAAPARAPWLGGSRRITNPATLGAIDAARRVRAGARSAVRLRVALTGEVLARRR